MVAKPYYRVDLFNREMTNTLLTSLLVTTIENKTVAHIGTSDGRLLQVQYTNTANYRCTPTLTQPTTGTPQH